MAVSLDRGSPFFVSVLKMRALLLGVYITASEFLEAPFWETPSWVCFSEEALLGLFGKIFTQLVGSTIFKLLSS